MKKLILISALLLVASNGWALCIKGNCNDGYGTYIWVSGNKYVGEWKDGKRTGLGTYTYADGDKYVGEFKDSKRTGLGTYTWASGNEYTGDFVNNIRTGKGTYTWASGNQYVGEFKDGKRHGQGTLTSINDTNGNRFIQFVGKMKDGSIWQGTYTDFTKKEKFVSEWKDGKLISTQVSDSQTSAKNQTSKSSNNPAQDGTVRLKCDCDKKVSRGITFRCKEKDSNKILVIDRKKSTLSFDGDRLKITKTTKDYYFAKEGSDMFDTKIEINRDTLILEKKIFIDYTMFQCEVIERI